MAKMNREQQKAFFARTGGKKTSTEVVQAFLDMKKKTVSNTSTDGEKLFLFGNKIAERISDDRVEITTAGFATSTTKERLNKLPNVDITTRKFELFLNGKKWDGKPTVVSLNG